MGSTVDRRLEALEATFGEGPSSGPDELKRELFRETFRRLSLVEMNVMEELSNAYRSRPGLSPAEVWRELTEAQRAMESEWHKVVTAVAKEGLDADDSLRPERWEALKRDVVLAVANAPFWKQVSHGPA